MKSMKKFKWNLNECIKNKKQEVALAKEKRPLSSFINKIKKSDRNIINFLMNINSPNLSNKKIIAEIKTTSPTMKMNNELPIKFNKIKKAKFYQNVKKAAAISIITDKKYFNGSLNDIKKIRKEIELPILRKDFIIDKYQIYESRYFEADSVLLIASLLSEKKLIEFLRIAKKYDMICFIEIRNYAELKKIKRVQKKEDLDLVGVNSRDLKSLKVDINYAQDLLKKAKPQLGNGVIVALESGMTPESIKHIGNDIPVLMGHSLLGRSPEVWAKS